MDDVLTWLGGLELARTLRFSRWAYAAANASHILGLSLLVGAIAALDLRLVGAWRSVPQEALQRVLVPVAATGLAVAVTTGVLLFSVRPADYAALTLFWAKIGLIALGAGHALAIHLGPGLATLGQGARVRTGLFSIGVWVSALVCGRLLAFVGE